MAVGEKDEVKFEIVEKIGVLNSYASGWNKELNLVAWNGNAAKYDLRDWDPSHMHMSRGITLHAAEALKLGILLNERKKILEKDGKQKASDSEKMKAVAKASSDAALAEELAAVHDSAAEAPF